MDLFAIADIINIVIYSLTGLVAVVILIVWFSNKKGIKLKKKDKNKSAQAKDYKTDDVRNYVDFDDIKDDVIILDNYRTFIAMLRTNGIDYYAATNAEKMRVISNYIEYKNTISDRIKLYIQATEDNIDPYLKHLKDNKEKYLKEKKYLEEEMRELYRNFEKHLDEESKKMYEVEIQRKDKMLDNVYWNIQNIEEQENYIIAAASSNDEKDKYESYIVVTYKHSDTSFGVDLTYDEIKTKAENELDTMIKNITRMHAAAGVETFRLNNQELLRVMRSAYNPIDGEIYKINDFLKSNYFTYAATGETTQEAKNKLLLAELEG